jgi:hypothetical protein
VNSGREMLVFGYPYDEWIRFTFDERTALVPDWLTRESLPGRIGASGLRVTMEDVAKPDENEAMAARTTAEGALVQLRALEVTPDNMSFVGEILVDVKKKLKGLEERLKEITAPIRAAEQSARDLFRPAINALQESEKLLKQKIADSQRKQLEANRVAMAATQQALDAGDVRGAALASAGIAPTAPPAGVSTRPVLKFTVVDEIRVPRELCSPDLKKIAAYIELHGKVFIPGVTIVEDVQVSVRTK